MIGLVVLNAHQMMLVVLAIFYIGLGAHTHGLYAKGREAYKGAWKGLCGFGALCVFSAFVLAGCASTNWTTDVRRVDEAWYGSTNCLAVSVFRLITHEPLNIQNIDPNDVLALRENWDLSGGTYMYNVGQDGIREGWWRDYHYIDSVEGMMSDIETSPLLLITAITERMVNPYMIDDPDFPRWGGEVVSHHSFTIIGYNKPRHRFEEGYFTALGPEGCNINLWHSLVVKMFENGAKGFGVTPK